MNESNNESVTQPETNSVQSENVQTTTPNVDGYKKDMFKYKDQARDLQAQLDAIALEKEQKNGNYEGVITSLKDKVRSAQQEAAMNLKVILLPML